MTKKELYKKYKYIVAYHEALLSLDYYIEIQVNIAEQENAPVTAYTRDRDGWLTIDEANDNIKELINSKL